MDNDKLVTIADIATREALATLGNILPEAVAADTETMEAVRLAVSMAVRTGVYLTAVV